MKKAIKSLYGNVAILKGWCPDCKGYYFVLNGNLQCCGNKFIIPEREIIKRETITASKSRRFATRDKKECLESQNHCCMYCGIRLGEPYWDGKRGKYIVSRTHFDHFSPYIYDQNNTKSNLIASCNICNLIKSDKMFVTIDEARVYIQSKRESKKLLFPKDEENTTCNGDPSEAI